MVSREVSIIVNWFLDNICPPVLRDCKWFIYPLIYLAYGKEAKLLFEFKERMPFMNESEIAECYRCIENVPIANRPVDANKRTIEYILSNVYGMSIGGGGGGYLMPPADADICLQKLWRSILI
jgi:hypothetical protein